MDTVVWDLEIARTVEEAGGWDATDRMGIAYAALYEYRTNRMRVYGAQDLDELKKRLEDADKITSFNGVNFDARVLYGFSKAKEVDWLIPKSNDLLLRIWQALGNVRQKGFGLDPVAAATLGVRKTGNGAEAPKWFQAGLHAKVIDYCIADVMITKQLSEFIDNYSYIINPNTGEKLAIAPWVAGVVEKKLPGF